MTSASPGLPPVPPDDPCSHDRLAPGCCLIHQLRLTSAGGQRFLGRLRGGRAQPDRAFGGGLIAQALLAAASAVPDGQRPGSLHAYFISPGDVTQPVRYTPVVLRGGRSSTLVQVTADQVTADQEGAARLVMLASFRIPGAPGAGHQRAAPPAGPPPPPPGADAACRCDSGDLTCGLALHPAVPAAEPDGAPGTHRATWMRSRHSLGAAPQWHAAVLGYLSDIATIRTVDQPHRHEGGQRVAASADHALWFHRPFRADDWLWYAQRSPVYAGGRGLCRGEFYRGDGALVASCVQEVSLRRVPAPPEDG